MLKLSTIKTTVEHEGDTWKITDVLRVSEGHAFCVLTSTTRKRETLRGAVKKVSITDWLPIASLFSAAE